MLAKKLEKFGFEPKEATLYLALLELGEGNIKELSLKSGLKRTTVYHVLDSLKEKGLVSQSLKGHSARYVAEEPNAIGGHLFEQQKLFQKTLPELLSITNTLQKKPKVKFFEGMEGIREVYNMELEHKDSELLRWWSGEYDVLKDDYMANYYMPERIKRKIWVRSIAPDNAFIRKQKSTDERFLRKIRIAKLNLLDQELEITLFGKDKVAIKSFVDNFALLIESVALFKTLKGIFELQWMSLEDNKYQENDSQIN